MVTWEQIARPSPPPADARIAYGADRLQFGDLRLPDGTGPHPLAIVIHGGCWRAENDLGHASHLSAALTAAGVATWTIEYRRIGDSGGGWPGTFEDVVAGAGHAVTLAERFPLDTTRVVLVGHSAGGHLALWLAARHRLPRESPFHSRVPFVARGVVGLAAITDLRTFGAAAGYCNESVAPLLGGTPNEVPGRYAQANPLDLLPLGIPVSLLHGTRDKYVPVDQARVLAEAARALGDAVTVELVEDAGHFDLIAPFAPAWRVVEQAVLALVR